MQMMIHTHLCSLELRLIQRLNLLGDNAEEAKPACWQGDHSCILQNVVYNSKCISSCYTDCKQTLLQTDGKQMQGWCTGDVPISPQKSEGKAHAAPHTCSPCLCHTQGTYRTACNSHITAPGSQMLRYVTPAALDMSAWLARYMLLRQFNLHTTMWEPCNAIDNFKSGPASRLVRRYRVLVVEAYPATLPPAPCMH